MTNHASKAKPKRRYKPRFKPSCATARPHPNNRHSDLDGRKGRIRDRYYQLWPYFLGEVVAVQFPFTKRERRPPSNELNALISFGNSLCYNTVLRQIYRTALDPTIAFFAIRTPGDRRFSLSLDIAEVFSSRCWWTGPFLDCSKTGEIGPKHFEKHLRVLFVGGGRKIFVQHWDARLSQTVQHRTLDRKVSYERLIRLECYKLVRHLTDPIKELIKGCSRW
ncbi:MAG: CRISPR-associated endonuclease Cas1 [Spirosomataceae bacterium]